MPVPAEDISTWPWARTRCADALVLKVEFQTGVDGAGHLARNAT